MTLIERINSFANAVAGDIKSLYANKVNKTDVIDVAHGGTGATTLTAAQTNLGIDKVVSANTRLTTKKQEFPNVFVDSNGMLRQTQLATWLDHAKMYNGLVPNGSFQMGDATGWKIETSGLLTRDTKDFPFGANASLRCDGGTQLILILDKIAVNPYMKYRLSAMFKYAKVNTAPAFHAGFVSYDVDTNEIHYPHAFHYGNTVTTLAQDLKQGDTKIYLTSLNGWAYNAASHQRGFKFYNYTDSRGYLYDPAVMPYSRYYSWSNDVSLGWWQNDVSSFNSTENSITLRKPWDYPNPKDTNGTWLAGTKIAQCTSGSVYSYGLKAGWMRGQIGVTQWEYQSQEISGVNTTINDNNLMFRAGTAYIAPLFWFNDGGESTGDVTKVSNLYFEII